MIKVLKHISILIPALLLATIILGVSQPGNMEIMLPAQSGEAFKQSTTTKEIKEMRMIIEKSDTELLNKSNIQTNNNSNLVYKGTKE